MRTLLALVVAVLLAGCAGEQTLRSTAASSDVRNEAADIAARMAGQPYVYGGDSPSGFDCSGLVHYAYEQAGAEVPRTTNQQYRAVRTRYVDQLARGDVIFFRLETASPSHVGIYIGDGRFVHALNADHPVRIDRLDDRYWQRHIVRAGSLTL